MEALLAEFNPWWSAGGPVPLDAPNLPRQALARARTLLFEASAPGARALIVLGPRQVGKTHLANQVIEYALTSGLPPRNVVYADMEDAELRGPGIREVIRRTKPAMDTRRPALFVFDEVQYAEDWAQQLKFEVGRRSGWILATGSASSQLIAGMKERLPGRHVVLPLHGLNFREFVDLRQLARFPFPDQPAPVPDGATELEEYLIRGGMPKYAATTDLHGAREEIRAYCRYAISADIVARSGLRNDRKLNELFVALIRNPGALLNYTDLARGLGQRISPISVENWVDALEAASLIHRLPPSMDKRPAPAEGRGKRDKVYPADPAFSISRLVRDDAGPILETAVFRHLLELKERLQYALEVEVLLLNWRTGDREADFVLRAGERSLLVEVKSGRSIHNREAAAVARRAAGWRFDRVILVCRESRRRLAEGVEIVPAAEFLLQCSAQDSSTIFRADAT